MLKRGEVYHLRKGEGVACRRTIHPRILDALEVNGERVNCRLCLDSLVDGMKYCSQCRALKLNSEFHPDKKNKTALTSQCKDCRNAAYKQYRKTEKGIQRHRREMNAYRSDPEYNKTKIKARQKLQYAVRRGYISRPDSCQNCQTACKPHGHHHLGYAPEHWYDVAWLCNDCHIAAEKVVLAGGV